MDPIPDAKTQNLMRLPPLELGPIVYTDGGVIGRNPSEVGGTWAYAVVGADDKCITNDSGIVTPAEFQIEAISNNFTELYAVVIALTRHQDAVGTLCTDSYVTQCRLVNAKPSFEGIPKDVQDTVQEIRGRIRGKWRVILLDGHPNAEQLKTGIGKRGNPCSKWNVLCDTLCNEAKLKHKILN